MKPGDWTNLASLPPTQLVNRLLDNLDALGIGDNDADVEDEAIESLPEPLRILYLLNWMDYEVSQGSLMAYLFNSHGRHARAAADGLGVIGAGALAAVVRRAAEVADSHRSAWDSRHAEVNALPAFTVSTPYKDLDGIEALSELTDEYWSAERDDDWGAKLEAYLSNQTSTVREWAAA